MGWSEVTTRAVVVDDADGPAAANRSNSDAHRLEFSHPRDQSGDQSGDRATAPSTLPPIVRPQRGCAEHWRHVCLQLNDSAVTG